MTIYQNCCRITNVCRENGWTHEASMMSQCHEFALHLACSVHTIVMRRTLLSAALCLLRAVCMRPQPEEVMLAFQHKEMQRFRRYRFSPHVQILCTTPALPFRHWKWYFACWNSKEESNQSCLYVAELSEVTSVAQERRLSSCVFFKGYIQLYSIVDPNSLKAHSGINFQSVSWNGFQCGRGKDSSGNVFNCLRDSL